MLLKSLEYSVYLFVFLFGIAALAIAIIFIIDVTQTKHAIRRNYPVVGRLRYFFENLGGFFRQYFFAMDREELPFNRAERSWIYRAAKNLSQSVAFGSTRDLRPVGTILFVNTVFPTLGKDTATVGKLTIGEDCRHPYTTQSFFHISGMSYGALSKPAIRALAHGAGQAGCWLNTGEGGLAPYHLEGGADIVFQIGTAKYGVRDKNGLLSDEKLRETAAIEQVKMFEIKLSQGAKPGKGGILPGSKVTDEIANIRGIEAGVDSNSPNRHPEIKTEADLLDMVNHVREVTGKPVGFKTVIGDTTWLDNLCKLITERGFTSAPDFIVIDSADGGTGAAPMSLMDNMGLPIRESLPAVVNVLQRYRLRERIHVIASGKLVNPAEVAWALCAGANFVVSARGFMFSIGCIQALHCNKNTCPTGITTHDERLQKGLVVEEKAERVKYYVENMVHEVGVIAHSCGVREPRQLRRHHARIVTDKGNSIPLDVMYRLWEKNTR